MEARVVTLPLIHLVGYRIEATVEAFESGLGKNAYRSLLERRDEIPNRNKEYVLLMQMYPLNPDFNAQTDPFTHLIGYEVSEPGNVPADMVSHTVGESKYVTCKHIGPESELSRSYEYLYGQWLGESGCEPKDYDFEIWDERYKPESPDNVISIFVALK